jgi:hypothetical protein
MSKGWAGTALPHLLRISGARKSVVAVTWRRRVINAPAWTRAGAFRQRQSTLTSTTWLFRSYLQVTTLCTMAPWPFWNSASGSISVVNPVLT